MRTVKNLSRKLVYGLIIVSLGLLAGCGNAATPAPTATPTQVPPTPEPMSTATAAPTATPTEAAPPTATPTSEPAATPVPDASPTATGSPTPEPSPTNTATPEIQTTAINALDPSTEEDVTVRGRVVATSSFSKGFKFTLDDGTGQATLLMWHNVYDECPDAPQLNIGATVIAEGKVGQYEGEVQIEPPFPEWVDVVSPGGAYAPEYEIGALGGHLNELATVTGEIENVEDAGSGVKIWVKDDTGQVMVFIWESVLERIPQANPALGTPGTRVRVTGEVQEYKGALEIVPTLPYDVEVLQ
mgnify:CR=1 FL=1